METFMEEGLSKKLAIGGALRRQRAGEGQGLRHSVVASKPGSGCCSGLPM